MKIPAATLHVAIDTLIGSRSDDGGPMVFNFTEAQRLKAANELLQVLNHVQVEIEAVEEPDGE